MWPRTTMAVAVTFANVVQSSFEHTLNERELPLSGGTPTGAGASAGPEGTPAGGATYDRCASVLRRKSWNCCPTVGAGGGGVTSTEAAAAAPTASVSPRSTKCAVTPGVPLTDCVTSRYSVELVTDELPEKM